MKAKRHSSSPAKSKAKKDPKTPVIDGSMNVLEILALHPDAGDILAAYGLHCHGCAFGSMDSLEEGAYAHGLTDDDVSNMVVDLEELLRTSPPKPKTFTLTEAAAKALLDIAKNEGKDMCILQVLSDGVGGFCMEFGETMPEGDVVFTAPTIDDVKLCISPAVLQRVGGGAVDLRDGRFKLDLPPSAKTGCGCGGNCSCKNHAKAA